MHFLRFRCSAQEYSRARQRRVKVAGLNRFERHMGASGRRGGPPGMRVGVATALVATLLSTALGAATPSRAASLHAQPIQGVVGVFPGPGSRVVSPQAQIAFRGVNPYLLASVQLTGSQSGAHAGTVEGDSDADGGSFVPTVPFTPGETVTVTTSLDLAGAPSGTYQFQVASP